MKNLGRKSYLLLLVGAIPVGLYLGSRRAGPRATAVAVAPPPMMSASTAAPIAAPLPVARRTASATAPTPHSDKDKDVDRYWVRTWLDSVVHYNEKDRGSKLDELESSLVQRGARVVSGLAAELAELHPDETVERAAVLHALGAIGAKLASEGGPEATAALATIHGVARTELELPDFVAPNPAFDADRASPMERRELVHRGAVVEMDGKLVQPTILNKVSAIQMLTAVGDDASREQLEALEQKAGPRGVRLAANEGIRKITTKNQ